MDFFISNAYAQSAGGAGGSLMGILPLLLMLPIFEALKKGDEVVTNGGLGGTVTKVGDAFLTMRVAEGMEVNVQKQAVAALLPNGTLKAV